MAILPIIVRGPPGAAGANGLITAVADTATVDLNVDGSGVLTATALGAAGSAVWGGITGTLSAQTDLQTALNLKATVAALSAHTGDTANPHAVTKTQVGLGNVDNTSDVNKPVSTAQAAADATKQPLDTELTALAGLVSAADRMPYFTGSGTAALAPVTSFIRTLLDDADAATARATLGVGTGTGDVVGPAASVDSEIALFSGTTGKLLTRATTTGMLKATSGVIASAVAGSDYYAPGSITDVAIADGGTGASTAAAALTNLGAAPTASPTFTGTVVLPANQILTTPTIGSFTNATHTHTNAAGGGQLTAAALSAFDISDSLFRVVDNADATKKLALEVSGFTTGTTRTLTPPNFDGTIATLAGTETLSGKTLTTPTIASFVNATHPHQSAAGGGTLDAAAIAAGTIGTARLGSGTPSTSTFLRGDQTWATPAGSGDVVGPAASVDGEGTLFSGTTGKLLKRSTLTGLLKATSGVHAVAVAGTDYYNPGGTDVAIADGGTGQSTAQAAINALSAVAGATNEHVLTKDTASGNALWKPATGGGGGSGDVVGPAASVDGEGALFNGTTGKLLKRSTLTGLLKATAGVHAVAVAGTDYFGPGSITKADVGLGNVDNTSDANKPAPGSDGQFLYNDGGVAGAASTHTYDDATGTAIITHANTTEFAIKARVTGNAGSRWGVFVDGWTSWGNGTDDGDVSLYRPSAGILETDGKFRVTDDAYNATTWNANFEVPTKNAVRDKIESLVLGGGTGDVVGPAASVDGEGALFSGTTGKLLKRSTFTGLLKATSGVHAVAVAGTDYYNPGGTDVAVADGGTGASNAATARTNLGLVIGTNVQAWDADLDVIAALADPNADRILFWDDSAGAYVYLTVGTGLSITGTTLAATGGGGSVSDTAYGVAWDGVTGVAPSQNAVYDKLNEIDTLLGTGGADFITSLNTLYPLRADFAAKGDIFVGTGSGLYNNFAVGTDGAKMVADSSQPEGVRWDPSPAAGTSWSPTSLGSSIVRGWFRADSLTGLSDGDPVTTWNDESGNGNHATQATTGDKPIYKVNLLNGLPGVDFVSSDRLMANISSSSTDETIIAVVDVDTALAGNRSIIGTSIVTGGRQLRINTSGFLSYQSSAVGALGADARALSTNTPYILGGTLTPTTGEFNINGTIAGGFTHSTTFTAATQTAIGARDQLASAGDVFDGQIYEVLICSALSTLNRQLIEGYLAWKWGLQANLPGGHPYAAAAPGGVSGVADYVRSGTAVLDFGAFPGKADASVAITGQTAVISSSVVGAELRPVATADHSADEHLVETIRVAAGNIVAGTGFTIYGFNSSPVIGQPSGIEPIEGQARGSLLYGQWNVQWRYV